MANAVKIKAIELEVEAFISGNFEVRSLLACAGVELSASLKVVVDSKLLHENNPTFDITLNNTVVDYRRTDSGRENRNAPNRIDVTVHIYKKD